MIKYLNKQLFVDGSYKIYSSTEGTSIKLINGVYLGLLGYNVYNLYEASNKAFNQSERENSQIMLLILGTGMICFNLKVARTVQSILIQDNGRKSYIQLYRKLGFSSKWINVDNDKYKGISFFLFESLRIPRLNIVDNKNGTTERLFFKEKYCLDHETMKLLLKGNNFKIAEPEMQVNVSERAKKKFNL